MLKMQIDPVMLMKTKACMTICLTQGRAFSAIGRQSVGHFGKSSLHFSEKAGPQTVALGIGPAEWRHSNGEVQTSTGGSRAFFIR